ncbi:small multidrug resistance pump [Parasphingorhabdus marina DSM 22363]|uniref:Small multidrug resistance pump n=1 Tax=Parasphingorhabdus marina DSM 22363 TaxID=1123272 RepID=A0A1N6CUV2_9SPHN|nr:multidrug efflux SMR transporter [Parasphingorhabdus marina]SIN62398.1 small multidrug resistance pump [Parasphingorhabdus marina DSM 22363]
MSGWGYLAIAIALEIVATTLLKLSDGFAKWHWGVLSIACYSACFWVLAPALKVLPVGVVYAIWSGIGIVAITVIGVFFFDERLAFLQFLFIALILIGAVGLQLTTTTH